MKKSILQNSILTFILGLLAFSTTAQTLVASYPFNGNANDAVGTANGTVNGATLTTDRFGNTNSAYNFNGTSTNFITGNCSNFPTGDRTVSLWFNADAGFLTANEASPFSYGGNPCGSSFLMILNNTADVGKYQTQGHCLTNRNAVAYNQAPESNWYNWVVTINGTTIKMFINGVLINTTSTFLNPTTVLGKDFNIGAYVNNNGIGAGGGYFKGKIDDIKIYNQALTDAQIINTYLNDVKKPGSGNALQLTSIGSQVNDPRINLGSGYDFDSQPFTYETWLKRDDLHTTNSNFGISLILSENNNGWGVGIDNANRLFFTKVGVNASFSTGTVADLKWHHLAVVYNGTQIDFYIDGVSSGTNSYTDNFNSGGNYTIGARQAFGNSNGDQTLNGLIDETRIWRNVALTQTQIRDWMCKKITLSHPQYQNLVGYFRFDEGGSNTTGGYNGNFGTLVNSPTWQTSGAALGDASAHDYLNAIKTSNISHPTGENFAVTSTSGNPSGVQVYRVDEQPNTLTGASGVGTNDKYFGVFQAGGTTPQYTAVYNYTGNPLVGTPIESQLRLNKRTDNAATWTVMPDVANEPTNTITVTGQSTEYILGRIGGVLPITDLYFTATKNNNTVAINWKAANETNIEKYDVEKSGNGFFYTKLKAQTSNGLQINNYSTVDANPINGINYYRLKIYGKDGTIKYSEVVKVLFEVNIESVVIKPNPIQQQFSVQTNTKYTTGKIMDLNGRLMLTKNATGNNSYNIPLLAKGIYVIEILDNEKIVSRQKVMIQ